MGRLVPALVIIFNIILIFLSLYSMTRSVDFLFRGDPGCINALPGRDLAVGAFMFVLGVVGIICLMWRARVLKFLYLVFLVMLLIMIVVISGLVFLGTSGPVKDDKGEVKDFALERYSRLMQYYLVNRKYWVAFKKCVVDNQVCTRPSNQDFAIVHLQEGCCNPPSYCGFQSNNDSRTWVAPNTGPTSQDQDCNAWSNDHDKRCLDCDSCRAAYIENSLSNWYYEAGILLFVFLILIILSPFISHNDDYNNSRGSLFGSTINRGKERV